MPDMLMPQVAPPKVADSGVSKPVKGPEKLAETDKVSSKDQGFSEVLKKRLETPEKAESQPPASPPETESKLSEPVPTAVDLPADGKPLPASGKLSEAILAALTADDMPTEATPVPLEGTALTAALQAVLPHLPADVMDKLTAESKPGNRPNWLAGRLQAWAALNTQADTNALDKSAVARAVEAALEQADVAFDEAVLARFGADLRAVVSPQQTRSLPLDNLLERLQLNGTSPTPTAATASLNPQPAANPETALPRVLPTTTLDVPFRQTGWDQALSERVMWLTNQKLQGAEIKLNPPQLGPIEVRIQMHQDQAQVSFTAHHASVREALEAAMPRLREMFAANGLDLGDVNVSQHSFAEQRQMQTQQHAAGGGGDTDREAEGLTAEVASLPEQDVSRVAGLVTRGIDLFA